MNKNILIVENETSVLNIMEFILSQSNYNVIKARTGKEALHLIFKYRTLDLCYLKTSLPDISGFSILNQCSKKILTLPIILITDKSIEECQKKGYTFGAYGILYKPFDIEEILMITNQILRKAHGKNR
jgi:DNA-binding response OmpR family regulator